MCQNFNIHVHLILFRVFWCDVSTRITFQAVFIFRIVEFSSLETSSTRQRCYPVGETNLICNFMDNCCVRIFIDWVAVV